MSNKRRFAVDPDPIYSDAVSVSRFWRLVDVRSDDECWQWLGDTDGDGYGVFFFKGRRAGAHEFALSFTTGERKLPELDTCHSCDNPPCCNPCHLRFGTRKSNVADMVNRGRASLNARKLSDEDVMMIRNRRAAGARQKDLARDFGVCDATISGIVTGNKWRSVGGPIEEKRSQYRKAS